MTGRQCRVPAYLVRNAHNAADYARMAGIAIADAQRMYELCHSGRKHWAYERLGIKRIVEGRFGNLPDDPATWTLQQWTRYFLVNPNMFMASQTMAQAVLEGMHGVVQEINWSQPNTLSVPELTTV